MSKPLKKQVIIGGFIGVLGVSLLGAVDKSEVVILSEAKDHSQWID